MTLLFNSEKLQAVRTVVINGKYRPMGKINQVQICELNTVEVCGTYYQEVTDNDNEVEQGCTLLEEI